MSPSSFTACAFRLSLITSLSLSFFSLVWIALTASIVLLVLITSFLFSLSCLVILLLHCISIHLFWFLLCCMPPSHTFRFIIRYASSRLSLGGVLIVNINWFLLNTTISPFLFSVLILRFVFVSSRFCRFAFNPIFLLFSNSWLIQLVMLLLIIEWKNLCSKTSLLITSPPNSFRRKIRFF